MKIATYCITFPEEIDILPNMIGQAKKLGDVWLIDGGPTGHLCHHPRPDTDPWGVLRLSEDMGCIYARNEWPGTPGAQRNHALKVMEPYGYDWIIQNDSDELWPDQSVELIPGYLDALPSNVTNIQVKVLPLVEDEDHYSKTYAHHLTHARINTPGAVRWGETWHEHQFFEGERRQSGLWLLHTNWLFTERLRRIKGHGLERWGNVDKTPLPPDRFELTWPKLQYPPEDSAVATGS